MKLLKKTAKILEILRRTTVKRQTKRNIKKKSERFVLSPNSIGSDLIEDNEYDTKKKLQKLVKQTMT